MTKEIKQRIEQIKRGEVPHGYKKGKLGIVPSEWEETHLRSKFERLKRKNAESNTNVLTISAQHGLINQNDFFNKEVASENKSNYFLLKHGEFAYNKSYSNGYPYGAIKKLVYYDKGVVSPLYICFFANKANEHPEFYEHYFEAGYLNKEIWAFAQEGARNHGLLNIAVEDFFNSYILSPSTAEQQKIAEILTMQDKVIELKEKLIAEKQQQKKWLMQNLLTGKKRLSGFSGEWGRVKLKSISKKIINKNAKNKYKNVFTNSAQHGIIPQRDHFDKDIANIENINGYYIVKQNDFVYNPRISVTAPCGPINCNLTGLIGIISPLYTVFRITVSDVNIDYLQNYFIFSEWYGYAESVANYGARFDRMNISDNDFFAMTIKLPPLPEQTAIAEILSTADSEIDLMKKDIAAEKQKKKALMQLLLTGIMRVNK